MTETASIYGPVSSEIPLIGERLRGLAEGHHPLLGEALGYVFETTGKHVRPALVLLSGHLGEFDVEKLVILAASLEVVHTASLVHDDTIDQALTRRGLKTINAVWDSKVAILVGDFLFAQSAELASRLNSVRIMHLLSETVMAMTSGELRQYSATRDRRIDEDDYLLRIAGKTGSLFSMCCQGAAIVSEQTEDRIAALRAYGSDLGLAFQIADDVLDFEGTEETLGKPAGSDLRQGTITLPVILLSRRGSGTTGVREKVEAGGDVELLIEAVLSSGVLEEARVQAEAYAARARNHLAIFPRGEAREALEHLTEYVIRRAR